MKRIKSLLLIILGVFTLASCDLMSDSDKCEQVIENIVFALDNQDTAKLKELFSLFACSQNENIDNEIEEAFSYYKGPSKAIVKQARKKSENRNGSDHLVQYECAYEIETSDEVFQLAVLVYTINTYDKTKVGVESIYLFKKSESQDKEAAYWGDGLWTIGFSVGVVMEISNEEQDNQDSSTY